MKRYTVEIDGRIQREFDNENEAIKYSNDIWNAEAEVIDN